MTWLPMQAPAISKALTRAPMLRRTAVGAPLVGALFAVANKGKHKGCPYAIQSRHAYRTTPPSCLAACRHALYKPVTQNLPEEDADGGRAHILDHQARCDGTQPDRRHQCRDREGGPAHRCAEA